MSPRIRNVLLTTSALLALEPGPGAAGPEGSTVVGGSATISGSGTSNVTVQQSSERAIINWHSFNLGAGETTTFQQPNSSSVTLNRVTGGMGPSSINGTITANGKVFLINGDGILFGPSGIINTAAFLATTNDIANEDFMAGRYNFNQPGNSQASIVNYGSITAARGGFAALVAPGVRNSGTITATLGSVALASGNTFTLDFYGDRLITLAVGSETASQVIDVATGQPLKSLVTNEGKLKANGGRVELTAAAARMVVDSVINNTGVIEANTIGSHKGMIVLSAATSGTKTSGAPTQTVKISGKISANGKQAGTQGGTVVVTGENIQVTNATINATGQAGGGKVMIGGDWGGGNPNKSLVNNQSATLESYAIATASTVNVSSSTTINVSAKTSGNGGKVVLWSESETTFAGTIYSRGGSESGNGGFAEVSSHANLYYTGFADMRAPNGTTGTVLLDPDDFHVVTYCGDCEANEITASNLSYYLSFGNYVIATNNSINPVGKHGDIFVEPGAALHWTGPQTLTLSAYRNIYIDASINALNGGTLVLRSGGTVTQTAPITVTNLALLGDGATYILTDTSNVIGNFAANTGSVYLYSNGLNINTVFDGNSATSISGVTTTGAFTLNGGAGTIFANSTIDVGTFTLQGGAWIQNSRSLPYFHAYDFRIDGGSFMRVAGGSGSGNDPYRIADVYGLQGIINTTGSSFTLNESYVLANDIDATGTIAWNAGAGIRSGRTFNGLFDGQNYTISGLTGRQGLFGNIGSGGTVTNLNLSNVNITAGGNTVSVGGLSGANEGTVSNVNVSGIVSGGSNYGVIAGGLIGTNRGLITRSTSASYVSVGDAPSGAANVAGGLVGSNQGMITLSSAIGAVSAGSFSSAGGLAGQNGLMGSGTGYILSSYASGLVFIAGLNSSAGGLVGVNSAGSTIINSQAFGAVTSIANANDPQSFTNAGGLVGLNLGTITSSGSPSASCVAGASYSCASGAVRVGSLGVAGGLVGFNGGTITYAFATGSVTGAAGQASYSTNLGGLAGTNQGTIAYSFATGNVGTSGISYLNAGGLVGDNSSTILYSFASGNVQTGDYSSAGGLVGDNTSVSCNGSCNSGGDGYSNAATIAFSFAIGNVSVGSFAIAGGLAGAGNGVFSNTYSTGSVTGGGESVLGGLVGAVTLGDNGTNGTVTQSNAFGSVTSFGANSIVGGLVGINLGTISSSGSWGTVSGTSESILGGLVGLNFGTVTQSYSLSAVTGSGSSNIAGGLVGANAGKIEQSSAQGAVTSGNSSSLGGLVGANLKYSGVFAGFSIAGSSFPTGTITNSYSTGSVTGGENSFVGGLVGENGGSVYASFASGNVTAGNGSTVGGFVGSNSGPSSIPSIASIFMAHCQEECLSSQASVSTTGGTISSSYATGTVTAGNNTIVGGFFGLNLFGSIDHSYATGNVTGGDGSTVGGFGGLNIGTVNVAYSTGAVVGANNSFVGGFVGVNFADPNSAATSGVITQSFALGSATGGNNSYVAGFVAINVGSLDQTYAGGFVSGGTGSTTGGLVASNTYNYTLPSWISLLDPAGTATNSYWDKETTGQTTSAGGTGVNTSELTHGLPSGFNSNVWGFSSGKYPYLLGLEGVDTTPAEARLVITNNENNHTAATAPSTLLTIQDLSRETLGRAPSTLAEVVNTQAIVAQQQPQGQPQPGATPQTGFGAPPIRLNVGEGRYFYLPPIGETRVVANEAVLELPCDVSQPALAAATRQVRMTVLSSQCLGSTNLAVYRVQIGSGQTLETTLRGLAAHRIIVAAQANYLHRTVQDPAAPAAAGTGPAREGDPEQYVVDKLSLTEVHRLVKGNNVSIAVIDSEIDGAHPDLAGAITTRYDATNTEEKPHPHGTGMAGAIGSHGKLMGIAPGAKLIAIRAFSSKAASAESTTYNILKGLDHAVANSVRIVNMSFAGPQDPSFERDLKKASDKGLILIAAAGNAGPKSPPLYPAANPYVIAVTATDMDDKLFSGANRGKHVAIAAPGVDILVPAPEGTYQLTTGTSVATAHVSGVVALMLERNPRLTPAEVRRILTQSAKKLGPANDYGAGLIDPVKALELAAPKSAALPASRPAIAANLATAR
jgi:filamentous hemagglutinin family protein